MRKATVTKATRQTSTDALATAAEELLTVEAWRKVLAALLEQAEGGDPRAFDRLLALVDRLEHERDVKANAVDLGNGSYPDLVAL